MFEGKSSAENEDGACCRYSYPRDLARFVRDRWNDVRQTAEGGAPLPDTTTLEDFCSACYQAGLLREEERPVIFRAILAAPVTVPG